MKWRWLTLILIPCLCFLFTACDDDDDDGDGSSTTTVLGGGTTTSGGGTSGADASGDDASGGDAQGDSDASAQVPLTAPTLKFPPNGYSTSSGVGGTWVSLEWNAVAGAESYNIRVWIDGSSDTTLRNVGTDTGYVFASAVNTYKWQVQAVRGSEKVWSEARTFTVRD